MKPSPTTRALTVATFIVSSSLAMLANAAAQGAPESMLFQALRRGDDVLLQSLLREGRSANVTLTDGTTPLMMAALYGSADSVKWLLDRGADAKAANKAGVTALLWGAGDPEKVRFLLEHGADPNARSQLGNTPLIAACRHPGATVSVERLLKAGANAEADRKSNRRGASPLENAATAGNVEVVRLLLKNGIAHRKNRALAKAVEFGKIEIVKLLLDAGADPNSTDGRSSGHSLDVALLSERPEIARLLLEHGADIEIVTGNEKDPPVVLAAFTEKGDDSTLKELIARGADVNAANEKGETAYTFAKRRGHGQLVKVLLEAGATETPIKKKEKKIPNRNIDLHAGNLQEVLRGSIAKSLALLQKSSDVFLENRESCVSCHHQNLPAAAFGWARNRGFQLNDDSITRLVDRQDRWMKSRVERAYQMDEPVPVPPRLIGWGLLGFSALDRPADEVSDALVYYLAAIQQPDGHWDSRTLRPPMGGGEVLSTTLAMRTLQVYPPPGNPDTTTQRVARTQAWLRSVEPQTHQEEVFRLLGLGWSGVEPAELAGDAEAMMAKQRSDGGWAQLPGLQSDAWATGQSLIALSIAGGMPTTHPNYQRGLAFLLKTQFDDGSWFVPTRTWPFQPHFDSQFPHGKDQWISAPATAWAAMAMTLAVDPFEATVSAESETNPEAAQEKESEVKPSDVDFAKHIKPVLERSCAGCHGKEKPKSRFKVTDRQALLRGGESGIPSIIESKGAESPLIRQVRGQVEDMEMPPLSKRERYPGLTTQEIDRLSAWIDGGAPWPDGIVIDTRE
jgi:ankyrin repeat protein/mono/diheme cytochrome c family protein